MNTNRNNPGFASHAAMGQFGRQLLCAVAACVLTVVLLGAVGKSPAQAAQRAAIEQGITNLAVI